MSLAEIVPIRRTAVSVGQISDLIDWAVNAPVEEVTWRLAEIGEIGQWVRAQKEATELRVKAVRLELIALRRIAQGGLVKKIAGVAAHRNAAEWLAALTDGEFDAVLTEIDGDKSPIALYQADRRERKRLEEALHDGDAAFRREAMGNRWDRAARNDETRERVQNAATVLLDELLTVGEPFTVVEAAERLAAAIGADEDITTDATVTEGLREVVRSAIRSSSTGFGSWQVPKVLTVTDGNQRYLRVPFTKALVWHLEAHANEVRLAAERSQARADDLRALLNMVLDQAVGCDVDDLDEREDAESVRSMQVVPILDSIMRSSAWRVAVEDA